MIITQIIGQLAMMAITGIAGWLGGKLKGAKTEREQHQQQATEERDQMRAMVRLLLYYRLHDLFEEHVVDQEAISSSDKREIEELYNYYHDTLHGNGEGTRMYRELMDLKTT